MNPAQTTETRLQITRRFDAPRDKVYRHFTEPKLLAKWYAPGPMKADVDALEPTPGGALQVRMTGAMAPDTAAETHTATGTFQEIVPEQKLVHTWTWKGNEAMAEDSVITVEFADDGGGTKVTLTHEKLPHKESVESHMQGWQGCLENLAQTL